MNKNVVLVVENTFVWLGVFATFASSILPIIQVLAGLTAFFYSLVSIYKLLKK